LRILSLQEPDRPAPNAIIAPNFKFEDMGIGGLDTEFSEIFRRAFASRVFPPGLVEKLGIQHVKGKLSTRSVSTILTSSFARNSTSWATRYWKDPHRQANRKDA